MSTKIKIIPILYCEFVLNKKLIIVKYCHKDQQLFWSYLAI